MTQPTLAADTPPARWQTDLKRAYRTPRQLGERLGLPEATIAAAEAATPGHFPFLVTQQFAARMRPGRVDDPLLLQVWPGGAGQPAAASAAEPFEDDPVGDAGAVAAAGLLHKYRGRVLLVTSGACAIHCRYCFRQHFDYSASPRTVQEWQPAIDYVAGDPTIREVIFSGGDPLMTVDARLERLVSQFAAAAHVRRLRIHTRLPVVLPSRVDDSLAGWLRRTRLSKWVVVHCNHAAEIDAEVEAALERLRDCGCTILNQAVLLAGVNDSADAQLDLCERLIDCNVVPYYLNQLDRVRGAESFAAADERALEIVEILRRNLPGYAVPRLVQERAREPYKTPLKSIS